MIDYWAGYVELFEWFGGIERDEGKPYRPPFSAGLRYGLAYTRGYFRLLWESFQ